MKRILVALGIIGLASLSTAGLTFTGINDYSTELTTNPGGKIDVDTGVLTSDLYINSLSFASGNLSTSGFSFDTFNTSFKKYDGSGTFVSEANYAWGSKLDAGYSYNASGVFAGLFGFFGTASTPGIYTGTIDVLGGSSDTSSDLLGSVNVTVEVVNSFGLTVTYPQSSFLVNPGQTKTLQHRLQNTGSRDLLVASRYYSGPVGGGGTPAQGFNVDFDYSFYPSSLAAGSDQTVGHMIFTGVDPSGPVWVASSGIFVGYNSDDLNSISGGDFSVQAVPEPATMTALALGGALLARRRRRAN